MEFPEMNYDLMDYLPPTADHQIILFLAVVVVCLVFLVYFVLGE